MLYHVQGGRMKRDLQPGRGKVERLCEGLQNSFEEAGHAEKKGMVDQRELRKITYRERGSGPVWKKNSFVVLDYNSDHGMVWQVLSYEKQLNVRSWKILNTILKSIKFPLQVLTNF